MKSVDDIVSEIDCIPDSIFNKNLRDWLVNSFKKKVAALKPKRLYISKDFRVAITNEIVNGVQTTKLVKELRAVSVFLLTNNLLFEFRLEERRPEELNSQESVDGGRKDLKRARYDCVNINTIKRLNITRLDDAFVLELDHSLSFGTYRTIIKARTEDELKEIVDLEEYVLKIIEEGK